MDYWNPAHIPTNCSNKLFRYRAPGAMSAGVNVKKLDDAGVRDTDAVGVGAGGKGSAGRAGDQKAVGCTFKPVTTHNAL